MTKARQAKKAKALLAERQAVLAGIRHHRDVLVLIVGAGINGASLFRELALQKINVLLVDRGDYCCGTSAAPSRMIHAGLRYTEFGEFKLVREGVKERNLLLQNAPHYIRPLPTTIPIFSWLSGAGHVLRKFLRLPSKRPPYRGRLLVTIGLTLYDFFARKNRVMPRHRFASRREALARRPLLDPRVKYTATYYDAWVSYPERLCLELLLDGEQMCGQAKALSYVSLQSAAGQVVTLRDELTGDQLHVRPKTVVNATGARIDFTNRLLGRETDMIAGTKGAHLVLDNDDLLAALDSEMLFYETPDGRVSVALPWLGKPLVGSTDIRVDDPDEVTCDQEEIDYMLGALNEVLPDLHVDRSQILSTFTGVRPLRGSSASATVQMSRAHYCAVTEPTDEIRFPIFSMIGGKWTPFRAFGEQAGDMLLARLGRTRRASSRHLAIGGGRDYPGSDKARRRWLARLGESTGLDERQLDGLLLRSCPQADRNRPSRRADRRPAGRACQDRRRPAPVVPSPLPRRNRPDTRNPPRQAQHNPQAVGVGNGQNHGQEERHPTAIHQNTARGAGKLPSSDGRILQLLQVHDNWQ